MSTELALGLAVTACGVIAAAVFVIALCKAAAKPTPAVPPAHPRRRVEITLDDIEWDWRRDAA